MPGHRGPSISGQVIDLIRPMLNNHQHDWKGCLLAVVGHRLVCRTSRLSANRLNRIEGRVSNSTCHPSSKPTSLNSLLQPNLFHIKGLFQSSKLPKFASVTSQLVSVLLLSSLLVAGCQRPDSSLGEKDERPEVLTTFTVLADLARNVAGDRLRVRSIVKPGAEIHGYQPTPSDLEQAVDADLIVENGLGLELWFKRFTSSVNHVPTVTLSEGMQPLLIEEDVYAGKPNPHAWMSPKRTMAYVDRLVKAFSKLDPDGSNAYFNNGLAYKKKLQELDQTLTKSLSEIPKSRRMLVSCEGAFSYLAEDYGLEEAYLWPVNAESQATPRRMAKLIDTIRDRKVPTIFCESTVSDEAQREVAAASGAKFGGIFYVDSLSGENGPAPTLLDLQRHNVDLLVKGLNSSVSLSDE